MPGSRTSFRMEWNSLEMRMVNISPACGLYTLWGVKAIPWTLLIARLYSPMDIIRKYVKKTGVNIIDRITITDLLKQDSRIIGAIGISVDTSDLYVFKAKATIRWS